MLAAQTQKVHSRLGKVKVSPTHPNQTGNSLSSVVACISIVLLLYCSELHNGHDGPRTAQPGEKPTKLLQDKATRVTIGLHHQSTFSTASLHNEL